MTLNGKVANEVCYQTWLGQFCQLACSLYIKTMSSYIIVSCSLSLLKTLWPVRLFAIWPLSQFACLCPRVVLKRDHVSKIPRYHKAQENKIFWGAEHLYFCNFKVPGDHAIQSMIYSLLNIFFANFRHLFLWLTRLFLISLQTNKQKTRKVWICCYFQMRKGQKLSGLGMVRSSRAQGISQKLSNCSSPLIN